MFGQIDGGEMAYSICERPECDTGQIRENDQSQMAERLERCTKHQGRYFEKAGGEKIDIETDVSDSE